MKSIKAEGRAKCPNHCEEFDVEYWSLVRADQDPDLKTAALGGELNLVCCPECKTFFHHDGNLIYLDAPNELMIFVFPHTDKDKEAALAAKMKEDYQTIKQALSKTMHLDYPPFYVFGLDGLKQVLEQEEKTLFESEVVAAAAAAAGCSIVRLKPGYAREKRFPLYVPAPMVESANGYALAAHKVIKQGLQSLLLQNFLDQMSQEGASLPVLA